jgi:hypothetical protein
MSDTDGVTLREQFSRWDQRLLSLLPSPSQVFDERSQARENEYRRMAGAISSWRKVWFLALGAGLVGPLWDVLFQFKDVTANLFIPASVGVISGLCIGTVLFGLNRNGFTPHR